MAMVDKPVRAVFVDFIARHPEVGDVVPETGGVRKVRWGRQGSGKPGGVRVIYFFNDVNMPLYLLMIYAKARQEDMSQNQKDVVRALTTMLKQKRNTARRTGS